MKIDPRINTAAPQDFWSIWNGANALVTYEAFNSVFEFLALFA